MFRAVGKQPDIVHYEWYFPERMLNSSAVREEEDRVNKADRVFMCVDQLLRPSQNLEKLCVVFSQWVGINVCRPWISGSVSEGAIREGRGKAL